MIRLQHDVSWETAHKVLELFNLREEEKAEALPMVAECIKAGLQAYQERVDHERNRLKAAKT